MSERAVTVPLHTGCRVWRVTFRRSFWDASSKSPNTQTPASCSPPHIHFSRAPRIRKGKKIRSSQPRVDFFTLGVVRSHSLCANATRRGDEGIIKLRLLRIPASPRWSIAQGAFGRARRRRGRATLKRFEDLVTWQHCRSWSASLPTPVQPILSTRRAPFAAPTSPSSKTMTRALR
jgi:hypothetical protein